MTVSRKKLRSASGATLNTYWGVPGGPVSAVVQINHGLAEHAGRYERFMEALADAGFASVAHDHRGHGETVAPDSSPGVYANKNGHRRVIEDIKSVTESIRYRWPDTPIICFGHSAGGLMALNYATQHPKSISGLAVWNSNAATGMAGTVAKLILSLEGMTKGWNTPSKIMPKLTFDAWNKKFDPTRTRFDWLSRDKVEVAKYVSDPQCGFHASTGMWRDVMTLAKTGENKSALRKFPKQMPIYLLGGAKDPATENGKAVEKLARTLQSMKRPVKLDILPKTRHETLNETNRDEVTQTFIEWVKDVVAQAQK